MILNFNEGALALPVKAAEYIKLASPKAVKVLFYFAVNRSLPEDPKEIDRSFTADDVEEAVSFWKRAEVMEDEAVRTAAKVTAPPKFKTILPSEIAEIMESSPEIRTLFGAAEGIFARPLRHDEQRTLIWIHDHLGLPADVIAMLLSYSYSAGRATMAYIERVAIDWSSRGISTLEAADEELISIARADDYARHISSLIHVRNFTPPQIEILSRWDKWGVSDELIMKAHDISVEKKGSPQISFMDGIVKNWRKDGISTPEEADSAKEK